MKSFAINATCRQRPPDELSSLANLLGSRSEVTISELGCYRGPLSAFSALLKYMDTSLLELSIDIRCDVAIELAANADVNNPELFLLALGCSPTFPPAMNYQNRNGTTLLHAVGWALGNLSFYSTCNTKSSHLSVYVEDREQWISGWNSILQGLVAAGADLNVTRLAELHDLRDVRVTPMSHMLYGLCYHTRYAKARINPQHAIMSWISILSDSGVELREYGLQERSTWKPVEISTKYIHSGPLDLFSDYYFGNRRLITFDYGPSPKDWRIWENEPTDEFAGEFWFMLDKKEEIMPGTWID